MNASEFFGIQCPAMFKPNGELDGNNNVVRLGLDMYVDEVTGDSLSDTSEKRLLLRAQYLSAANKRRLKLREEAMVVYGD